MTTPTKNMINNEELVKLTESFHFCETLAKNKSSFYAGMYFTSNEKRKAIYSIYAWLRVIDDIADDTQFTAAEKLKHLQNFYETTLLVLKRPSDSLLQLQLTEQFWPAFKNTVEKYHIPISCLEDMLNGQKQDLVKYNYQTFAEVYQYCRLVASSVGIMCVSIWGHDRNDKVMQLAEWSGIAFQLTNILRDIKEDLARGRVYLPAEYFDMETINAQDLKQIPPETLLKAMHKIIDQAQDYYQRSLELYPHLDKSGKLSFLVMVYYYRALFEKIRNQPESVLAEPRVKLNKIEILMLIIAALINDKLLHHG